MAKVIVACHSGYGHTQKQAEAVRAGAASVAGVEATLVSVAEADDATLEELTRADAIIFGAPTYMGGPSAAFKRFADASSKTWAKQAWKDKIAGGFTNSASLNGDKDLTLHYFVTLAMQHSMIWVGTGLMPSNTSKSQRNDVNRLGSYIGPMAQSDADVGPEAAPPPGDLETARLYGRRVAEITVRMLAGKASARDQSAAEARAAAA
jgi:NAD(P)H dehydrogenase (quinone)